MDAPTEQRCGACGTSTVFHELYRKWGYRIGRCASCGVVATVVGPEFDPASVYTAEYFEGGMRDGYAGYGTSEDVLRAEFRHVLAELMRAGCERGKLLEIGCAYGFFLEEARRQFEVTGVELSRHAADHGRARGLEVHCGPVEEELLLARGPFDAVVMLDVIEHLERPAELLALLREHVVPGGLLLITTGDWDSLLRRITGSAWRLLTPPQHLFFFSRETLTRMLAAHGFEVQRCTYPWKRVPAGLILHQACRMLRLPARSFPRLDRIGIPVNLFDALRLVARRV